MTMTLQRIKQGKVDELKNWQWDGEYNAYLGKCRGREREERMEEEWSSKKVRHKMNQINSNEYNNHYTQSGPLDSRSLHNLFFFFLLFPLTWSLFHWFSRPLVCNTWNNYSYLALMVQFLCTRTKVYCHEVNYWLLL